MDIQTGAKSKVSRLIAVLAVAISGGIFASRAGAVIITPGTSVVPNGSGVFSGTIVDNETSTLNSGTFIGSLHSVVYQQSNGWLDFVYQFSNTVVGGDSIETLSLSSYNGLTLNADYQAVTNGVAPNKIDRTPFTTASDDTLNYIFNAGVAPGSMSDLLVVQTTATSFYEGSASAIDTLPANVPAPMPVPEPATAAIAGFAMCALGMRRRNAAGK